MLQKLQAHPSWATVPEPQKTAYTPCSGLPLLGDRARAPKTAYTPCSGLPQRGHRCWTAPLLLAPL